MGFTSEQLLSAKSRKELMHIADQNDISVRKAINKIRYEIELTQLQTELVNLQQWVAKNKLRVVVIFEGRDAAGKGGSIKRFKEHLNPRSSRVVALPRPTEMEQGQWYFRRYIRHLPNPGEIVFFDRSWYNRAVVEPVMGFCSKQQYSEFMAQVPEFEHMLYEDNVKIIKFWFSISKSEQKKRFEARQSNPLKQWKFSPVDMRGQELWDSYTFHKEQMFAKTHTNFCPWIIVKTNSKKQARLESMRYVLNQFEYDNKGITNTQLIPDPNIVHQFYRNATQIDL